MAPSPFKKRRDKVEEATAEAEALPSPRNLPVVVGPNQPLEVALRSRSLAERDPTEDEYGLKILHDPQGAAIDIIFIHGLTGNRESTWTRKSGKHRCFWPEDLLPTDIENARIATWGYDADVIRKTPFRVVSTNTLQQHADSLCTDLANLRAHGTRTRPIIFVVHSLGGLVCKAALLHSAEARTMENAHIREIAESSYGVLFMGTPHQGSSQAGWGSMLASLLGYMKQDNADIVRGLEKEAPELAELQRRFYNLLASRIEERRPLNISCCFEELPVPVLGMIVPSSSAEMDGYKAIPIHANHMDMTKFGSDDSLGYIRVLGELRRWIEAATSKRDADAEEVSPILVSEFLANLVIVTEERKGVKSDASGPESLNYPSWRCLRWRNCSVR
ncbi:hypothetical protein W97_05012 [Coniosporium apollinis CBS 100218]|uniref:DUF676 domain-containing protein n=1 Tax=Coniosporium apollinis (strain CBS 100218) TaxID=1168221 RepID=R7YVA1_CONA1|nr:uncharacterized protein W97_05012 [Coniosporium apollinis CBS 100218]EON65773.1 hypothetical protein W97_05012 [Coniosporium apollinis CBS 100218]